MGSWSLWYKSYIHDVKAQSWQLCGFLSLPAKSAGKQSICSISSLQAEGLVGPWAPQSYQENIFSQEHPRQLSLCIWTELGHTSSPILPFWKSQDYILTRTKLGFFFRRKGRMAFG